MKIVIALLLSSLIIFPQAKITIPSIEAQFGFNTTLSVSFENDGNSEIFSFGGKIFYDLDVIEIIDVRVNSNSILFGKGLFVSNYKDPDVIIFGWAGANPFTEDGLLFDIEINLKRPGTTILTSYDLQTSKQYFQLNNGSPEVITQNGEIVVLGTGVRFLEATQVNSNTILVPIEVINFYDVGSLSWRINFQGEVLSYLGVANTYQNIEVFANSSEDELNIGWFDMSSSNSIFIDEGKFMDIRFSYMGGETELTFSSISEVTNSNGERLNVKFEVGYIPNLTSIDENMQIPSVFDLAQNYPNPFNPSTSIRFGIPMTADVSLKVFNILGQEVKTLLNKNLAAGFHTVNFNASDLISGMYIYRIQAQGIDGSNFLDVKKMLLVK